MKKCPGIFFFTCFETAEMHNQTPKILWRDSFELTCTHLAGLTHQWARLVGLTCWTDSTPPLGITWSHLTSFDELTTPIHSDPFEFSWSYSQVHGNSLHSAHWYALELVEWHLNSLGGLLFDFPSRFHSTTILHRWCTHKQKETIAKLLGITTPPQPPIALYTDIVVVGPRSAIPQMGAACPLGLPSTLESIDLSNWSMCETLCSLCFLMMVYMMGPPIFCLINIVD